MIRRNQIKEIFDGYAGEYNKYRRMLIPCFDELYRVAVEVIPHSYDESIKVLDLGAGTGLLSFFVASVYKNADFLLVDVAGNMLAQAETTLSKLQNKFEYLIADYSKHEFDDKFDVVISALSIHHLTEIQKNVLFREVYNLLNPGGFFINLDQVKGDTPAIDKCYRKTWISQVRANGVSEVELAAAFERMKEDKMSTLGAQMLGLQDVGFGEVNCWYKNYSFVVFGGRKIAT